LAFAILPSPGFLPPSPPAEQATARQDQAGQASTGDGAGNRNSGNSGNVIKRNRLKISGVELSAISKGLNLHLIKSTARKSNKLPASSNITAKSIYC
jgi:hypothetical protein